MAFQYKFGFGGFFNGRGAGTDACIGNAQTNGTWNGHIAGSGSTIDPDSTASGLIAYECKWDAKDVNGNVEFSLGVAGDKQEPNTNDIAIAKDGRAVVLSWSGATNNYVGSDLEFTTYMNTLFIADEEICLVIGYLPVILIHYDFSTLDIGVRA